MPFPSYVPEMLPRPPMDGCRPASTFEQLERLLDAVAALRLDLAELRAEIAPPASPILTGAEVRAIYRRLIGPL